MTLSLAAQSPAVASPPRLEKEKDPQDRSEFEGHGKKEFGMGRPMFGPAMGGPQFEKMVELALGRENDLEDAVQKWLVSQNKGPEMRTRFLKQIENFRRFLRGQALREAEKMGLKISAEQEDSFIREFWKKKLELEAVLRKEIEPRKQELTDKMNDELKNQFSH